MEIGLGMTPDVSTNQLAKAFRLRALVTLYAIPERLLLSHVKTLGFLAPGGEEFNPGPETRLDRSELLYNKVLFKYKGDRESF